MGTSPPPSWQRPAAMYGNENRPDIMRRTLYCSCLREEPFTFEPSGALSLSWNVVFCGNYLCCVPGAAARQSCRNSANATEHAAPAFTIKLNGRRHTPKRCWDERYHAVCSRAASWGRHESAAWVGSTRPGRWTRALHRSQQQSEAITLHHRAFFSCLLFTASQRSRGIQRSH